MSFEKNYQPQNKPKGKSREKNKKAYKPKPPFRTVEGVGTLPWKKLDMGAIGVFMKFYDKFNGYNRYSLSVTYNEVKNKISSLIFTRYLWQLIGFGFLDIRRTGRLMRNCSLFGISNRWRELDTEPEKLAKIETLLKHIEILKRKPGSQKKRMQMWKHRNEILKLGKHPQIKHGGIDGK